MSGDEQLARGLGWFSIGLGLAQIAAPRSVAKLTGVRNHKMFPALGAREIASGIAMLTQPRSAAGAWSRVGGDAMDLSLLGRELAADNPQRDRLAATAAAVAAVTILDVVCAQGLSHDGGATAGDGGTHARTVGDVDVKKAVTIDRTPEELYNFWHDFSNLPRIMPHLESVEDLGNGRSRWRVSAPFGGTVEWEAEMTLDRPNEVIAWRSVEGSQVQTRGEVRFMPAVGGRGTMVRVAMNYSPPGGVLGKAAAFLSRENPERQVFDALRAFKQVIEIGEITRSDGTEIRGGIRQRPAQPAAGRIAA